MKIAHSFTKNTVKFFINPKNIVGKTNLFHENLSSTSHKFENRVIKKILGFIKHPINTIKGIEHTNRKLKVTQNIHITLGFLELKGDEICKLSKGYEISLYTYSTGKKITHGPDSGKDIKRSLFIRAHQDGSATFFFKDTIIANTRRRNISFDREIRKSNILSINEKQFNFFKENINIHLLGRHKIQNVLPYGSIKPEIKDNLNKECIITMEKFKDTDKVYAVKDRKITHLYLESSLNAWIKTKNNSKGDNPLTKGEISFEDINTLLA